MRETISLQQQIPVVANVDVVVAGGGIAGATAAIAAARNGCRTVLVDRYGSLGGNIEPGMFSGGVLHLVLDHPKVMMDGLHGIPAEFIDRCEGYCDGQLGHQYLRDSEVASYVWHQMMHENQVQLLLNSMATDPIMEGDCVVGLIVESKSGSQAVNAKVVIDATGDADIAMRAGAPIDEGRGLACHPGMYFAIANVDVANYAAYVDQVESHSDDRRWVAELFERELGVGRGDWALNLFGMLVPHLRAAWESGEYRIIQEIGRHGKVLIDHGIYQGPAWRKKATLDQSGYGILGAQVGVWGENLLSGDAAMRTELEIGARQYIYETARFLRRHVPGFEHSWLHMIAPFFHARGGRSAVPEYQLTEQDVTDGRRFDDVIFVSYPCDFPYRQLLPQKVDGLLMAGRSAIIQPPHLRNRWKALLMGQAAGLAAALAVRDDIRPRGVKIKELQALLCHKYRAPLGNHERLAELGLV